MTKLFKPLFSDKAQGTLADLLTYRAQKSGPSVGIRRRCVPRPSASQETRRDKFKSVCADWQALSSAEKQAYHDDAPSGLNGFQYYLSLNAGYTLADRYQYSKTITIDSTSIDSLLSWFPLAVPLSESAGLTAADLSDIFNEVGDNYLKIAIGIGGSETQLFAEVEKWDAANKKALLWVSRDTFEIDPDSDTTLTFYYDAAADDNTDYINTAGYLSNLWYSNAIIAYTMAQDPSAGESSIINSCGDMYNGTPHGSMSSDDLISGDMGFAIEGDGTDDYIDPGLDVIGEGLTSGFSLIIKFFVDPLPSSRKIISGAYNGQRFYFLVGSSDFRIGVGQSYGDIAHNLPSGQWVFLLVTYDGSTVDLWVNGSLLDSFSADWTSTTFPTPFIFGHNDDGSPMGYFNVQIEHYQISNSPFDSAWCKAAYLSMSDNLLTWS